MKLKNKVALVTGSTSGIGLAIARLYAQEGAKVVISSRHVDDAVKTAQVIKGAGGEAMGFAMDVSDEAKVNAVVKAYGGIDILVSNAFMRPITEKNYGIPPEQVVGSSAATEFRHLFVIPTRTANMPMTARATSGRSIKPSTRRMPTNGSLWI